MFLGASSLMGFFVKSLLVVGILSVMKAGFSRLRIDQALRFFWFIAGPLAVLDFVRALSGLLVF
jgi:NADH:ubiquinone oxidoreductase subunit H